MAELPPEEWEKWLKSLSREELLSEIRREEEAQATRRQTLSEIEHSIAETLATIEKEKLPDRTKRYDWRKKRIENLRRVIEEWNRQITRVRGVIRTYEDRIRETERELDALEELRAYQQALLRRRYLLTFIQRWIAQRRLRDLNTEIQRLRRRISGYRGYITTQRSLLYGREGVYEGMIQFRASAIAELGGHEKQLRIEAPLSQRLESLYEHLGYLDEQSEALKSEIEKEESRLEYKKSILPPIKLHRIKIRLYNEVKGPKGSPVGMFQAWHDVDAIMDPRTGEPDWTWWLTREEIEIAKYHTIGYFKGLAKWLSPSDVGQAYFDERGGIAFPKEEVVYARKITGETYTKRIPEEFIRRAERMTIEDLVVGESSVEPRPIEDLSEMGVFFQQVMIIGTDGTIKWQERRDRWIFRLPENYIEKVKKELGL